MTICGDIKGSVLIFVITYDHVAERKYKANCKNFSSNEKVSKYFLKDFICQWWSMSDGHCRFLFTTIHCRKSQQYLMVLYWYNTFIVRRETNRDYQVTEVFNSKCNSLFVDFYYIIYLFVSFNSQTAAKSHTRCCQTAPCVPTGTRLTQSRCQ